MLVLRWRCLGELLPFNILWNWEVSGGPMSSTWLSHLRGTGLTPGQPEHCDPVSHIAQKKREGKKRKGKKNKIKLLK